VAQALWERVEAGVRLRLIFDDRYFQYTEERGEEDELLRRVRGERRRVEQLPSKMILVDRTTAMLSVSKPGSEGFLVLVLRQEGLVAHCINSYEHVWSRASPF